MAASKAQWPYIINLGNSIIGVSVLAMPFCFKQCGVILGMLLLIGSAWLTNISCGLLMKAAITSKKRSYEFLAFHTFGAAGKLAVEVSIIGMLIGTCVAFYAIIGDVGPAIVSKITGLPNTDNLRTGLMVFLGLFVALPLGLLKSLDSLSNVSAISIGFYAVFVAQVFTTSFPNLWSGIWVTKVEIWNPEGVFKCLPIFALAFGCQTQLFVMYDALPEPSLKIMSSITKNAVTLCTSVYLSVGYFGYVAFCHDTVQGDMLMNFKPTIFSEAIKFGFVLSVAISFPLVIFPCRASIYTLLFAKHQSIHENFGGGPYMPDLHFKIITVCIVVGTLIIGIMVPNIEFILGLTGATMGAMICFIFPAVMYINVMSLSKSNNKSVAQLVLFLGVTILLASTYVTLYSQDKATSGEKVELPQLVPTEKPVDALPQQPEPKETLDSKIKDAGNAVKEKPPDKEVVREKEKVDAKEDKEDGAKEDKKPEVADKKDEAVEEKDEKRQEPPIPHAPDENQDGEDKAVDEVKDGKDVKQDEKADGGESKDGEKKDDVQKRDVKIDTDINKAETKEDKQPKEEEQKNAEAAVKEEKEKAEAVVKEVKEKAEAAVKEEKQKAEAAQKEAKQLISELKKQQQEQKQLLNEQKKIIQELKDHQKEHQEQEKQKVEDSAEAGGLQQKANQQPNVPQVNVVPQANVQQPNVQAQPANNQMNMPQVGNQQMQGNAQPNQVNVQMPQGAALQGQVGNMQGQQGNPAIQAGAQQGIPQNMIPQGNIAPQQGNLPQGNMLQGNNVPVQGNVGQQQGNIGVQQQNGNSQQQNNFVQQQGNMLQPGNIVQQQGNLQQQGNIVQPQGIVQQQGNIPQQQGNLLQQGNIVQQQGNLQHQGNIQQQGNIPQQQGNIQEQGNIGNMVNQQIGIQQQNLQNIQGQQMNPNQQNAAAQQQANIPNAQQAVHIHQGGPPVDSSKSKIISNLAPNAAGTQNNAADAAHLKANKANGARDSKENEKIINDILNQNQKIPDNVQLLPKQHVEVPTQSIRKQGAMDQPVKQAAGLQGEQAS